MKKVWQCDHCCHIEEDEVKMTEHESQCSYDPKFKMCYSCEHRYDYYGSPSCEKKLDVCEGEDVGNCSGWELTK